MASDTCDVDDTAATSHVLQLCPQTEEHACNIDVHDLIPFLVSRVADRDRSHQMNASNVCSTVKTAEVLRSGGNPLLKS